MRVVCCDGTWMAPSDVHVQTAGALEGEMAQDPGGPRVGYRRAASNGADREAGLKAPDPASPDTRHGGLPRAGGLLARLPENAGCASAERQRVGAGNRPAKMVAE